MFQVPCIASARGAILTGKATLLYCTVVPTIYYGGPQQVGLAIVTVVKKTKQIPGRFLGVP